MKKNFPLREPGKADARVIEAIKHDVRKYVKRERKKTLPPDFDLWEFACKVGVDQASAVVTPLRDVGAGIDAVVGGGSEAVYVEVIAVPARQILPTSVPSVTAPASLAPESPGVTPPLGT